MNLHTPRCVGDAVRGILHLTIDGTGEACDLAAYLPEGGRERRAWERVWGANGLDQLPLPESASEREVRADRRRDLCNLHWIAEEERVEARRLAHAFCQALSRTPWTETSDGYGWTWTHEYAYPGAYRVSVMYEGKLVFQHTPRPFDATPGTQTWVWPLGAGPEFVPYERDEDE